MELINVLTNEEINEPRVMVFNKEKNVPVSPICISELSAYTYLIAAKKDFPEYTYEYRWFY